MTVTRSCTYKAFNTVFLDSDDRRRSNAFTEAWSREEEEEGEEEWKTGSEEEAKTKRRERETRKLKNGLTESILAQNIVVCFGELFYARCFTELQYILNHSVCGKERSLHLITSFTTKQDVLQLFGILVISYHI